MFRKKLLEWYTRAHRDLPWRRTSDPYRIWVSEIMLQQTRVAAVVPYYERFLTRFPDAGALASAPDDELLAAWAGLGYYSRIRNMQKAARAMNGSFPCNYEAVRALPGIGDYTAAAIASMAFGLPHAAVDGNVLRVLSRVTNDPGDIASPAIRRRLQATADQLLDAKHPGRFNQAMMELGATVCLPKQPQCLICPVSSECVARREGTQNQLPVKLRRTTIVRVHRTVLVIRKEGHILLWQRPPDARKLAGFWELPEPEHFDEPLHSDPAGTFRHSITNHEYTFTVAVCRAVFPRCKNIVNCAWIPLESLKNMALSTTARKALVVISGLK